MATLYTLQLSNAPKGFGKPSIRAVPNTIGLVGNLCPETGKIVKPDFDAVRAALPHYYRKAFDRNNGAWWYTEGAAFKPMYTTLRNSRGQYLNTLYALPYTFKGDEYKAE